ncbi:hypothetical protein BDR07DRAFT_76204 [Suillus spraguei]|nr:hypothetical protein BDR07DRAFT_76204 [Suillus spraguei]
MKFLSAWWHIVVCHYTLWGQNFHHRDVNPDNLMVYKSSDGRYIGALHDFDLSSTQDSPPGRGRTGTVPFVAIELLTNSKIKHLYRHDAESFIWVLTWVSLRYREGMLLNKGRQLDRWLQVDAIKCRKEKSDFLIFGRRGIEPSSSHVDSWIVARSSLHLVALFYVGDPESSDSESELFSHWVTDAAVFKTWLGQGIRKVLPPELLDVCVES